MNSPKPAFLRYSLARLKFLTRFQVWMPVGAIALLGVGIWQYWDHPEWSGKPPAATTYVEDIPGNLLEDPIEGFGLEVPASPLEPLPGTEGTDQNGGPNAAPPLPNPVDLDNPLLTSKLFEQSQPPLLAPNNLSTSQPQPQNTSQQQSSPQLPQLPQLFKPLFPGLKNSQQLIPTSPAAPQPTQPSLEGLSQPKPVVVTENPLLRALERQSNPVDAGTQPPVAPNYTPNYVPNYAPNYAPQPAPAQPAAPGYQAPYSPSPYSPYNYGYNYGSQPAPSQPTAPNSPYQQPYGNPNVGYGNQPVPQPQGQLIQPRYNTNTPPGW